MKQWGHLGKYIIILKNSAIAAFSNSEVCNHNYDQDTLIFTHTNTYLYMRESKREAAVENKIKWSYMSTEGETQPMCPGPADNFLPA